ncbi:MAG TPA: YbaK/EbsC family protein [Myxococcaceae bacterium]|jgi:prolyl-tRNA editing enzyme YbaK/EbsC (Cys-tRNA(Pro) deacylase)|nr:YbaK/EbsC family protein [Myxococcaceae bacterium]
MTDAPAPPDEARIEAAVRAALDAAAARYEVLACDPAFADTTEFCARYGIDPQDSANAILVASRREPKVHALCLVLATTRLDVNHTVADLLGVKKLSFASADETARLTGMVLGGVTPFAIPDRLPLYVDARVLERPTVIVGGGSRSTKVRVDPEIFRRLPRCRVVEGLAMDRSAAS